MIIPLQQQTINHDPLDFDDFSPAGHLNSPIRTYGSKEFYVSGNFGEAKTALDS